MSVVDGHWTVLGLNICSFLLEINSYIKALAQQVVLIFDGDSQCLFQNGIREQSLFQRLSEHT